MDDPSVLNILTAQFQRHPLLSGLESVKRTVWRSRGRRHEDDAGSGRALSRLR